MGKNAILVVSFGTSHLDTLEHTIGAIEQLVAVRFSEYKIYRAFTSNMIIHKLKKTEHISIPTVEEALEQILKDGSEQVWIQPTHIINGLENDRMLETVMKYTDKFLKMRVGKPLLSGAEDYKKVVHAIMNTTSLEDDEMLILMGHGTDHHADSAYPALEYTFHLLGYKQVLVGTVEGYPNLRDVMTKLSVSGYKKVILRPFLVVAGDHVKNDMAGEEDSWKTTLLQEGYQVRTVMHGIGEIEGIQNIFVEHIEEMM